MSARPALDLRYVQLPVPEAVRSERDLTSYEQAEFILLRDAARRSGWVTARWLVKRLLEERVSEGEQQRFRPSRVSVLSTDNKGLPTRPAIIVDDRPLGLGLSIAHTARGVLVALARRPKMLLGVDLVEPDRAGIGPMDPWYTPSERRWIQQQDDATAAAQLWAIKQAYYKAANRGEPFSPRRIEVSLDAQDRFRCRDNHRSHDLPAYIAVTTCDGHVAALVAILPSQSKHEVQESYDAVIPQSELTRIGRI